MKRVVRDAVFDFTLVAACRASLAIAAVIHTSGLSHLVCVCGCWRVNQVHSRDQWRMSVVCSTRGGTLVLIIIYKESLLTSRSIITRLIFPAPIFLFQAFYDLLCLIFFLPPCAGPRPTTRSRRWFCWSWAMSTPTCSYWWGSWKDSTARWRSTRTPSEYRYLCLPLTGILINKLVNSRRKCWLAEPSMPQTRWFESAALFVTHTAKRLTFCAACRPHRWKKTVVSLSVAMHLWIRENN